MGRGLDQKDTGARRRSHRDFRTSQFGVLRQARRFDVGLFPLHSPLLRESRLVSFPPLNNMLKFSGCSRLNSGRITECCAVALVALRTMRSAGAAHRGTASPPRVVSRTRTNTRRTGRRRRRQQPPPPDTGLHCNFEARPRGPRPHEYCAGLARTKA